MRYQYNMERLTKLLRDFYRVSGVRIGAFSREYRQIAAIPEAASRFCTRLRQYPAIAQQCLDCDAHAFRDCREFSIYRCHMGIVEAVAPIVNDYTTYGYLMIGQLLDDTSLEEQWSHTRAQCLRYQVPANVLEELQTFFYELPIRQTEYIRSATELVKICARFIWMEDLIALQQDDLMKRLYAVIDENLAAPLTIDFICQALHMGKTSLAGAVKKVSGATVGQIVRERRIAAAKKLLLTTDRPINEIAGACGVSDYNYFTKVFKSETQQTPREFRLRWKNVD